MPDRELHTDAELGRPDQLPTGRLTEIVAQCLRKWDGYPTIPGSLRWRRNGITALVELESRLHAAEDPRGTAGICAACGGTSDVRDRGWVDEGLPMLTCEKCGGPNDG